jgi:hypothetical protein
MAASFKGNVKSQKLAKSFKDRLDVNIEFGYI